MKIKCKYAGDLERSYEVYGTKVTSMGETLFLIWGGYGWDKGKWNWVVAHNYTPEGEDN